MTFRLENGPEKATPALGYSHRLRQLPLGAAPDVLHVGGADLLPAPVAGHHDVLQTVARAPARVVIGGTADLRQGDDRSVNAIAHLVGACPGDGAPGQRADRSFLS